MSWLEQIDPNVVLGLVTAGGGWLWHRFVKKKDTTAARVYETAVDAWAHVREALPAGSVARWKADAKDLAVASMVRIGIKVTAAHVNKLLATFDALANEHACREACKKAE